MNLIIATGQNNLAMNRTVTQIAKHYIRDGAASDGILNRLEAGIRAYDPVPQLLDPRDWQHATRGGDDRRLWPADLRMEETGTMSITADDRVLVIGYGNTLRGDDALGRLVAASLADKKSSNVLAISVTQLVPELAMLVASARAVIFVDACANCGQAAVEVRELLPACPLAQRIHSTGPRELLAFARFRYDRSPPAWLVAIPGFNFDVKDRLSVAAKSQLASAIQQVQQLVGTILENKVVHA